MGVPSTTDVQEGEQQQKAGEAERQRQKAEEAERQQATETAEAERQRTAAEEADAPRCPSWLPREEARELALCEGPKQLEIVTDPAFWALHTNQLNEFMEYVWATEKYRSLKAEPANKYHPADCVNMHAISQHFIVPWTRNTGSSVALLINPDGLKAEVMVSHVSLSALLFVLTSCTIQAWGEDCEQLLQALESFKKQHDLHNGFSVWVCTYSQYRKCASCVMVCSVNVSLSEPRNKKEIQDVGPTIQEQIDANPFSKVRFVLVLLPCVHKREMAVSMRSREMKAVKIVIQVTQSHE